jgi:hypothetical protein
MFVKMTNKRTVFVVAVAIILVLIASYIFIKMQQPSYVGSDAKLSSPDQNSSFQIDNAAISLPPKMKQGVQATIQITKFSGSYTQGKVSYSDKSPTQQFIAVKAGDSWTIITHNSGKTLDLPDIKTAKKYHLPKGWYKS